MTMGHSESQEQGTTALIRIRSESPRVGGSSINTVWYWSAGLVERPGQTCPEPTAICPETSGAVLKGATCSGE
jgi:hypothetical protein